MQKKGKWAQESVWIRRNEQNVAVGFSEKPPQSGDFIPTLPKREKVNYDARRKEALVQSLLKAKDQAENAHTYLVENSRDPEEINVAALALEHIEIALEHLGVAEGGGQVGQAI